ncbi:MAG: hypothetical protein ACYCPF_00395 [Streptosporangiaceae bacterium]
MVPAKDTSPALPARPGRPGAGSRAAGQYAPVTEAEALIFTGEMDGVQADQLAALLGLPPRRASAVIARWRATGWADAAILGPGPRWVWLTRAGLARAGLPYAARAPGLSRLAHLRAVAAVRLTLSAVPGYREAGAYWRSERRLRRRMGGTLGLREHVPDGEVHWPDGARWADGAPVPCAGECWAIEAELTPKTLARTTAIMREILARTGDYGCRAGQARVPGAAARHARALYLCSPAARPVVLRARDSLGPLAGRVEIRMLPPGAALPGQGADGP